MLSTKQMNSLTSNPLFMVVVLLIGLIVILAIFRTASPFLNFGFSANAHIGQLRGSFGVEAFENKEVPVFVMFYAPWCGHCKRAKPEFERLMDEYKGNIKIIAINADEPENVELVKSQNIKGYPTIRYYSEGFSENMEGFNEHFTEYSGERTYSDFVKYLGSVEGVPDVKY